MIIFQHPLFWYSTPALIKEWIDLVLQHGFAFGTGGDKLTGKIMMNVTSAAGPEDAYTPNGYQYFPLRTFLTPLEQTARLCHMSYSAPYVLYSSLKAEEDIEIAQHVDGYRKLLDAICKDKFNFETAFNAKDVITAQKVNDLVWGACNDRNIFTCGSLFVCRRTVMVPIAAKLKLGSVLGYIIAGYRHQPTVSSS